jgi:hypothetical protein
VWIWEDEDGSGPLSGQNVNATAGIIFITLNDNGIQFFRDTLCVDLFTDISIGPTYGTILLRPDQVPGANLLRVSWLIDNAVLPVEMLGIPSQIPQANWVDTANEGAGMQLAIWDIVHDGGDGFLTGHVQRARNLRTTDANVLAAANLYLSLSNGKASDLAYVYENLFYPPGSPPPTPVPAQRLIGPMFSDEGPAPEPVPEPATFVLVGAALIAGPLVARRLRAAKIS